MQEFFFFSSICHNQTVMYNKHPKLNMTLKFDIDNVSFSIHFDKSVSFSAASDGS